MRKNTLFSLLTLLAILLSSCQPAPIAPNAVESPTGTATTALSSNPPDSTATPDGITEPSGTAVPAGTTVPAPTPTAIPQSRLVTIQVDPSQVYQTILEVGGGNFVHRSTDVRTALEPISKFNLKTLNPKIVRVAMDLDEWEPKEGVQSADRFKDELHAHATFAFMQAVKEQNPDTIFIASIWQLPAWMVSNPSVYSGRLVPPERYQAVAASIANWLIHARDEYGVEVPYISFNEANGGIHILLKPEEYIALIRVAGPHLERQGLTTRWLIGDASNIREAFSYGEPIWKAEDIRPYLGPFTFHSWDPTVPDSTLQQIGRFSDETGVEVWCTEGGWDPYQGKRSFEFGSWKHAINIASIYTRVLRDARATSLLYWQMVNTDFVINNGRNPYPALTYIAELQQHFVTGSQIVQTSYDPGEPFILSLAAQHPQGGLVVELINQAHAERPVTLSGLPDGTYTLVVLSEATKRQELDPIQVKDGSVELALPGQSITFLKGSQ